MEGYGRIATLPLIQKNGPMNRNRKKNPAPGSGNKASVHGTFLGFLEMDLLESLRARGWWFWVEGCNGLRMFAVVVASKCLQ